MANRSGKLEADLRILSRSILGEDLDEVETLAAVEEAVTHSGKPATISLKWWGEKGERQTLVLHEFEADTVLIFDPSRQLVDHLQLEGQKVQPVSDGMLWVSRETVSSWFEKREALGLITVPLNESRP